MKLHVASREARSVQVGVSRYYAVEVGKPEPEDGPERREELFPTVGEDGEGDVLLRCFERIRYSLAYLLIADLTPERATLIHSEGATSPGRVYWRSQ